MSDCVAREKIIEKLVEMETLAIYEDSYETIRDCRAAIEAIPAADVLPKVYSKPVKVFNDPWTGKLFTTCSACDGKISSKDRFCKHCGAVMRGEDDGT